MQRDVNHDHVLPFLMCSFEDASRHVRNASRRTLLVPLTEFGKASNRGTYGQFLGPFDDVFGKAEVLTDDNVRI